MPYHSVVLQNHITGSDKDRMKSLITSAGGKITRQEGNEIDFEVPDEFDFRLITKNLDVETISDHP
ncbi:hypothetical protein MW887_009629 [Aspergillus wentii]|nr:hypothetical protein MW887_009629 [Aspergillus wentii]